MENRAFLSSTQSSVLNPQSFALGWAAFLGCSWTWCIGMFLPVLMVRDFGLMGWVVFAVPNVIGAAAMGWVLARSGAAQRIVANHKAACLAFSAITIAFHFFFAGWLLRGLIGWAGPALVFGGAAVFYGLTRSGRRELAASAVVFVFSCAMFLFALAKWGIPTEIFEPAVRNGGRLSCLAPVCIFGFALCPYLDLTFLRARAMTAPRAGIAAFTIGFGVFFLLMIVFTLWYARWLLPGQWDRVPPVLAWILAAHICLQSAFTIALHARPLLAADSGLPTAIAAGLACVVAFFLPLFWSANSAAGAVFGEKIYRVFLGFYGLAFPAYVWICMRPLGRNVAPVRRSWLLVGAAIAIASPMYFMGFLNNRMLWLVPGLAVVLAARLFNSKTIESTYIPAGSPSDRS